MISQAKQYKRHGSMDPGHGCEKVVSLCCCCHVLCDKFLSLVVMLCVSRWFLFIIMFCVISFSH